MGKKIFMLHILLILVLSSFSCSKTKQFSFSLNEDKTSYTLVKYNLTNEEVIIPDTYNGLMVTKIGPKAFMDYEIKKVVFGKNIESVGNQAFMNSTIEEVILNKELETINNYAFLNCDKLKTINLNETKISVIGAFAFSWCTSLQIDLVLPDNLKAIYPYAFQFCNKVQSLKLNEGLLYIGDGAFNHCSSINNTSLIIPSSVIQIGGDEFINSNLILGTHVFYDFAINTLKEYICNGNNYKSIDGILYSINDSTPNYLVAYPEALNEKVYYMPKGVSDSFELAFGKNQYLEDIYLSDSFVIYEVKANESPKNYLNSGNNLATAIYCRNKIKNIYLSDTNVQYESIDGILYSKDLKICYYIPIKNKESSVITLENTLELFSGAIYLNDGVEVNNCFEKIILPDTLIKIDEAVLKALNIGDFLIEFNGNDYYYVKDNKIYKK